jgi:Tol biopolymer transport system component
MSPEQARGQEADKRADIWSYGVLVYEMLTGRKLFDAPTVSDSLAAVLRAELDWSALPAGLPSNIRTLLRRCLERDPKRRLRDIGDARLELDAEPSAAAAAETAEPLKRLSWIPWGIAALLLGTSIWLALSPIRTAPRQPTVQSFILPPEKVAFYPTLGISGGFALSPDGLTLAFVGSQDGKSMLWVRRLDSMAARPLPGTENAYHPFWSPDSRSIAFFADPKLKRVDMAGGPAQVICDATGSRGGTWNSEGTIVFALTGGLFHVPAVGGQAVRVKPRESVGAPTWPWFLPDGRHFLYSERPSSGVSFGADRILVGSIDRAAGSEEIGQLRASSNAMYVPGSGGKGWLLFAQQSTLFAQKFDAGRLKIEGEAVPIVDQVASVPGIGFAGFSVSQSGELVCSRGVGSNGKLVLLDREGKPSPVAAPPGQYQHPRLSPDGTKLALSVTDATGNADIWIMDLAHENAFQRFTFDPAPDLFPLWSPDGKQIAFDSMRTSGLKIFGKAANGAGDEETIASPSMPVATFDWSRDGRYILHLAIGATTGPDLFAYDLKERKDTVLVQTQYNESQGQFSPDGHWVAYSSDESSRFEVFVRSFTGNSRFQISANGGGQARWRGDGKELYYISEGKLMVVPIKEDAATFVRGTPRVLFEARALMGAIGSGPQGYVYDVTRDGNRFLVIDRGDVGADQPLTLITNWQAGVRK